MISHKRKAIVLAYRGTASNGQLFEELKSIALTPKVSTKFGIGKVEKYFEQAHEKLYDCVYKSMLDQISNNSDYNIWITGHSLGGAVASIASARLLYDGIIRKDKTALYTFGMPRVGDRQYALEHNRLLNNSWRVVHRADPVPHVPFQTHLPDESYHHRTEVYYPLKDMPPTANFTICPGSDSKCGKLVNLVIDDHKTYFNTHVGTYCQRVVGHKRSFIKSAMGSAFNNNACSRIKNSGYSHYYNRAMLFDVYVQITMLLILLKLLLFE